MFHESNDLDLCFVLISEHDVIVSITPESVDDMVRRPKLVPVPEAPSIDELPNSERTLITIQPATPRPCTKKQHLLSI